jgi:3-dehydroquinate dehydratase-2
MKLLIINGPNLNLLGQRNPEVYGDISFDEYFKSIDLNNCEISYYQSNIEGEIVSQLQAARVDGIILNAGGYTHTSVAIRDAVEAISVPVVEVHISNIAARESFRHESLISPAAVGCIFGFGLKSYDLAIDFFMRHGQV